MAGGLKSNEQTRMQRMLGREDCGAAISENELNQVK
jgi:hypothetical protein